MSGPPPPPPSSAPVVAFNESSNKPPSSGGRGDLLASIRKGKKLQKVPQTELKRPKTPQELMKESGGGGGGPKQPGDPEGFRPTGNPMLDEMQKKKLKKAGGGGGAPTSNIPPPKPVTSASFSGFPQKQNQPLGNTLKKVPPKETTSFPPKPLAPNSPKPLAPTSPKPPLKATNTSSPAPSTFKKTLPEKQPEVQKKNFAPTQPQKFGKPPTSLGSKPTFGSSNRPSPRSGQKGNADDLIQKLQTKMESYFPTEEFEKCIQIRELKKKIEKKKNSLDQSLIDEAESLLGSKVDVGDLIQKLKNDLGNAVKREDYERCVKLRDIITKLEESGDSPDQSLIDLAQEQLE